MFDEGSLFWIFSIVLRYHIFHFLWLVITISVAYGIIRFFPNLTSPARQFQLNKLFYAIVISQVIVLFLSAIYVSYHHNWSLEPHAAYAVKFYNTPYHFVLFSNSIGVGLLLCIFMIKTTAHLNWSDFGLRKPEASIWIILGLIAGGISVIIIFNYAFIYFKGSSFQSGQRFIELLNAVSLNWQIYYIVWSIIVIPLIEEIFFRGVIFATLKEISGFKIALALQAILFAFIHIEVADLLPHFVSGLILGYVYFKSKSLLPSIIIHSLQNMWAIGIRFL